MIVPEMRDWVKTKSVCLSLSVSGNNALRPLSPAICIHMKHLLKPANTSSSPAQVLCQAPAQVFLPVPNNVFSLSKRLMWLGLRTQVCPEWLLPHQRDVRPYKWNFYAALNFLPYFEERSDSSTTYV